MELNAFFLQQLERETVANRKVLERVPQGKNSWKPHERSWRWDTSPPWSRPCRGGLQ
jgi:hypothetical protein